MQLIKQDVTKSYTIEVAPSNSATATIWNFPDIPFLRNRLTLGIQLSISPFGVTTGKGNIGGIVANGGGLYPGFITLVDSLGDNFIQNLPIVELSASTYIDTTGNDFFASNTNGIFIIKPKIVVWNKCSILFPTATGLANYCAQFNIIYQ